MSLEGETILLREEREGDLPFLVGLRNDLDTQAWSQTLPPDYTLHMYRQRYESREFSYRRVDGRFIIVYKATEEAVGTISYTDLEPRWETTIGIMVARPFWGSGVALEAQEVLLNFLFEELGLRVVRLWTNSGNPRAIGLAQKSGFKEAIRHRQAVYRKGTLYDTVMMDLIRPEYYALHPEFEDHLPALSGG